MAINLLDGLICIFSPPDIIKPQNDCAKLESKRSKGHLMRAGFTQDVFYMERYEGRHSVLMERQYIFEVLWRQALIAGSEDFCYRYYDFSSSNVGS